MRIYIKKTVLTYSLLLSNLMGNSSIFEKKEVSLSEKVLYTTTGALLTGSITSLYGFTNQEQNFPFERSLYFFAGGAVIGGILWYPSKRVLNPKYEKIVFSLSQAIAGGILMAFAGSQIGWRLFDDPLDGPTYGFFMGSAGLFLGLTSGGIIGYKLSTRF